MEHAVPRREHGPLFQRPVPEPPSGSDPNGGAVRVTPVLHVERTRPPHDARVVGLSHAGIIRDADIVVSASSDGGPVPPHTEAGGLGAVGYRGELEDDLGQGARGGRSRTDGWAH